MLSSSKKWLVAVLSVSVTIMGLMALVTYLYDPYCYYRVENNRLKIKSLSFINPGIVKHVDYDTVLIGSSVCQNFDVAQINETLGCKCVKVSLSNLSQKQRSVLFDIVDRYGKCERLIYGLDLITLTPKHHGVKGSFPYYLYNDTVLDDYKYIYGFENWFRFLPVSIASSIANEFDIQLLEDYSVKVEDVGNWNSDFTYSEELLKKAYNPPTHVTDMETLAECRAGMYERADVLIEDLKRYSKSKDVIVFFPPYSVLYWHNLMLKGEYDLYLELKRYICSALCATDNVKVFDFQNMPCTSDLNLYRDVIHYCAKVNKKMVDEFVQDSYRVSSSNMDEMQEEQKKQVVDFVDKNKDWLKR